MRELLINFMAYGRESLKFQPTLMLNQQRREVSGSNETMPTPPVEDIEGHYRVAYYYAFLDHTISHLKTRFPPELEGCASCLLSPTFQHLQAFSVKIKSEFDVFLSHPSSFESQITTWKLHMAESPLADNKVDLLSMCNFAQENRLFYPNIHAILLLLLCLPIGSCSCEGSFSALRWLKTWCRSSMTNEWLDSLALGYINQEGSSTPEEVLRVWDHSGHSRVALAFRESD